MDFFNEKWNNSNDSLEEQHDALRQGIRKAVDEIIPQIESVIVPFYALCYECKHYFTLPLDTNKAYKRIYQSKTSVDSVIDGIKHLEKIKKGDTMDFSDYSLLELLQVGLDEIDAVITYKNEFDNSSIRVKIDKDEFINHVLTNIRENIETHAFGTSDFKNRPFTDKRVLVDIVSANNTLYVTISNNGTPFKGDVNKVFNHGYYHGSKGHTGTGMYSLKKTMQELGGNAEFFNGNNGVTYKLIFAQ